MSKSKQNKKQASEAGQKVEHHFVFGPKNYRMMIIGFAVIVLGFGLMYGKEDIYDFRKITLAPIIVIAGFVIEVFAILMKPEDPENESN